MELLWNISNLLILGFLITICLLGLFYRHISFGMGLGDYFGYFILFGVTLAHLILTIYFWQKGILQYKYLAIGFLVVSVFISLKATIWRGSEYLWNGSVFYLPCPTEISIENKNEEKELLIIMCTMEYYSKFSATWNGEEMEKIEGELRIPDELTKYISFPIQSILIQLDSNNRIDEGIDNGKSITELTDLRININYTLSGEVIKIVNKKPMFKVRINRDVD